MGNLNNCCQQRAPLTDYYSRIVNAQPAMFQLPNLQSLNQYNLESNVMHENPRITTNDSAFKQFQTLIGYLSRTSVPFEDVHFVMNEKSTRLNKLDRRQMKLQLLDDPCPRNLVQNNEEYTYLSAVFCYIADMKKYFEGVFCTTLNDMCIYIVKMYPNSKETFVAVDNFVPTTREVISYSSSKKPEIWMCVLEKAWAKLIGSYQKAKGLSPEDALQEILGIPAYSYQLSANSTDNELHKAIKVNKIQKGCVLLLAKQDNNDLKGNLFPRQVFYLQGIDTVEGVEYYRLVCSYQKFSFSGQLSTLTSIESEKYQKLQTENKNMVWMSLAQLHNYFQYCTFGYFKLGFVSRLFKLRFDGDPGPIYLRFTLEQHQDLNIRIAQYYQGYVKRNRNYSYSSVYIRLWNTRTKQLVSEGCQRSTYCVKTSNVFPQVFRKLQPGDYLLSIDIPFKFQRVLNEASLVTYSLEEVKFQQIGNIVQATRAEDQLLIGSINKDQVREESGFKYAIHWKRNSVFLWMSSTSESTIRLKANMKNSSNLAPIGQPFTNRILTIMLQPLNQQIIEFRKVDTGLNGELGSFVFEMF